MSNEQEQWEVLPDKAVLRNGDQWANLSVENWTPIPQNFIGCMMDPTRGMRYRRRVFIPVPQPEQPAEETPTPRTDAAEAHCEGFSIRLYGPAKKVLLDEARKLERELAQAKADRDEAQRDKSTWYEKWKELSAKHASLGRLQQLTEDNQFAAREQSETLKAQLSTATASLAQMRAALEAVHKQLECPCRNTTETSHRRDGSVIISSDVRAQVRAAIDAALNQTK